MNRWSELKDAFFALVECEPAEQTRRLAVLASADPELHHQLTDLLAADARGDAFQHLFAAAPVEAGGHPTRIGPYEVIDVLGTGGMGRVYRARDSRLRRDVAIKVLPAAFVADRERLARFEREAQVLATLNHPHIAHVYGLEQSVDTPALVMELVEGPTLEQLIAERAGTPMPLAKVLPIARQIADGLDAAHEKGIVHRDLKPGNVALTRGGDVKILDFGIAKSAGDDSAITADMLTSAGSVVGTPAYMSPEQARGVGVDKRTDVWAFACVLYELLTGRRAFAGKTASDSIAAVLERDPDMSILPTTVPVALRSLLRHCLQKDPRRRLRDIADARLVLDDVLNRSDEHTGRMTNVAESTAHERSARARVVWILALVAIGAAVTVGILTRFARAIAGREEPTTVFASIVLPPGMRLSGGDLEARFAESRFAIAPDGRRLAFVAAVGGGPATLWLRDLATGAFQQLPETNGASYPFWSPDSEYIAFVAERKIKKIRAAGGTPMTVCTGGFRLGAWSPDGTILFAPTGSSPLYRVPAAGGEPKPVTTLDAASGEVQHSYPSFLPDGRHFFYFSVGTKTGGAIEPRGVYVASLDATRPAKLLLPGATYARYANGRVLFLRGGTLMVQSFDTDRTELSGDAVPLVENVNVTSTGTTGITGPFSVSDNVLVYQAGAITQSQPVWFDRAGKQLAALVAQGDYADVTLSVDGTRLAMSVMDPAVSTRDIWLYDADGAAPGQRFTFDAGDDFAPVWSPDGTRLLFSSFRKGAVDLYVKDVNGVDPEQPVKADTIGLGRFAADWSRNGPFIMYIGGGRIIGRSDLWFVSLTRPIEARPLLASSFVETHGRFSPDGEWFVYTSNETGRMEVYVDRFPQRGAKRPVSTSGGGWARWSRRSNEIFYISADDRLMASTVRPTSNGLEIGAPRALFLLRSRPPVRLDAYAYDVAPDAQRFIVNTLIEEAASTGITLVLNWSAALKAK